MTGEENILNGLKINSKLLSNLKDGEEILIAHPYINGIIIIIKKDFILENVLGKKVKFYNNNYCVLNESLSNAISLDKKDTIDYINNLLDCKDTLNYNYIKTLKKKNLFLNDIVEFEDSKRGMVCLPIDISASHNINYILLKNNGELSKHKSRLIYSGVPYKKIGKYETKGNMYE